MLRDKIKSAYIYHKKERMIHMTLTPQLIEDYLRRLAEDERGAATIDKYRRDLLRFYEFLPRRTRPSTKPSC